ncbi:sensor histidine kinase KdpD [Acinetobacter junii]|uniref:histidine kinase n=1 Tax=Acinetobacter junii TaxID=40215 RepID=A0ABU8ZIQ2_ACIJU|nr:sensor histidine kinase KdpD [Acinetobacter junii]MBY3624063.1 sensor histidine kinase KdpD [Acinetobacter sp. CUI P1]MDH1689379.1 sensor histidine kinase KdpD [Acinetobacter junii]MDI9722125.1 sensor histidine kinase KdpD [Acinetobacter junii]QUS50739.1 sensor histidine kinase KdpD [Acinetobacter junii]QXR10134.1 sensor histidine kinase KdpD [Acinetobacter junii]
MQIDRNNKADAWLAHSQREQSGRLTIFLGAAPGVGKTFAMLSRAHELMGQGHHVLVGVVETHGRADTEALIQGLNVIPKKTVEYQDRFLDEMDLDQILKLKPEIVLVDELAHRNVPNSRHEYRWQDVNELLDAGIDVYSTLNIQHLESLNDVVYQITGIRVTETVPDALLKRLKDIRLVDLPVPELLERMNHGKIYLADVAPHALQGFFKPANLTALRDLAIQTVAGQVDIDYREKFVAQGQIIPIQNHVMLAIDGAEFSEDLVRRAHRIAERRNATWSVISIQKSKIENTQSFAVTKAFNLARKLGADTYLLYSNQIAATILQAAYDYGASNILLGKSAKKSLWQRLSSDHIADQLLEKQHPFEITFVQPLKSKSQELKNSLLDMAQSEQKFSVDHKELLESSFIILLGLMIAAISDRFIGYSDLALIFIVTVLLVAIRAKMLITLASVFICFLLYNYFFIEPRFTFMISAERGVITIITFIISALLVGRLANQLRAQVLSLRAANSASLQLQELERKLSSCVDIQQVLNIAKQHLESSLNAYVWLRVATQVSGEISVLNEKDQIAADWAQKNIKPCGRFTNTLTQTEWWFNPLNLVESHGVIAIRFRDHPQALSFELQRLTELMIEDIAQTLSRVQLSLQLENSRVVAETEKLRSALLSSVSHDLRSPLAAMIGSADTLKYYGEQMPEIDRHELLDTIHIEGERLDRYIQNLLDMTRLGHQGLTLSRAWIGVNELITSATERLKRYQPHVNIKTTCAEKLSQLYVHPALIEQAIFNVLENAAKFSPDNVPIEVNIQQVESYLQIEIEDQGIGIPENEREQIFDMFYTMQRGDRGKTGTGLGLSIVKAIIGAHMGSIEAQSGRHGHGTVIRIRLPLHQD